MPKVPQVFASGEGGGGGGVRADPRMVDYSGIQHAIGTLSQVAQGFVGTPKPGKLEDEGAKIEAELALTELERQFTDADLALKQDPTLTPETYARRTDENLRSARQGISKALQTPQGRVLFERASERFYREQSVKGKRVAADMGLAQVRAGANLLLLADENQAVFGENPAVREEAMVRGLARLQQWTTTGVLSKDEADTRTAGFFARIQEGQLKRGAQDPTTRPEIIENLLNGRYEALGPERQLTLAEGLMRDQAAAQKKQDDDLAVKAEAARKAEVDALDAKADRFELTDAELEQARIDRRVTGEDYRRLAKRRAEGRAAGGRTDDEVYNRLELDLLENPYSRSAKEIRRAQEEGKLAASGPRSAASLLKLIPEDAKDPTGSAAAAKDITQKPLFKQGLHEIRVLRGGKGPLESLTGEAAARLDNAEREYHDIARSGKFSDDQLPEVARKIVDRVRAQSPLEAGTDPERFRQVRYGTYQELLAAQKAGIIPDPEFKRQFKLMMDLGMLKGPGKDTPKMPDKTPAKKTPDARR